MKNWNRVYTIHEMVLRVYQGYLIKKKCAMACAVFTFVISLLKRLYTHQTKCPKDQCLPPR